MTSLLRGIASYTRFLNEEGILGLPIAGAFAAQAFGNLPLKPIFAITQAADGLLHSLANSDIKIFQSAWKIDAAATAVRALGLTWSSGYLIRELVRRTKVLPSSISQMSNMSLQQGMYGWAGLIGIILISYMAVKALNRWHLSQLKMEKLEELAEKDTSLKASLQKVTCSWKKPEAQMLGQGIYVVQSTVNIALAIFSKYPLTFTLLGIANLYTLYQMTIRNWLSIEKIITFETAANSLRVRFTYQPIFIQDTTSPKEDDCVICWEKKDRVFYFCENHSYHQACLTSLFISAMDNCQIVNHYKRTSHLQNGLETSATYSLYAQKSILPSCALCNRIPSQNGLKIDVWDTQRNAWCPGEVTWLDYKIGQKIKVEVTEMSERDSSGTGKLSDGTIVFFPQIDPSLAGKQVKGTIQSTFLHEGTLVLRCTAEPIQ